jgi:ABC-type sugar transport system substrate-binding protein
MLAALAGAADKRKFAIVPKAMNNPFFDIAHDGCIRRAKELDAHAPGSAREAYIGTNNKDLGRALGEMLVKAQPRARAGAYAMVSGGRAAANLNERLEGVREVVGAAGWKEVSGSPTFCNDDPRRGTRRTTPVRDGREVDRHLAGTPRRRAGAAGYLHRRRIASPKTVLPSS